MLKNYLLGFLVLVNGISANAATVCAGYVSTLAINPLNGVIQANIGYGVQYFCSVQDVYNSVTPQSCKSWYAMFLSAKLSGKKISMNFNTTKACNQIGSWAPPDPMPYWVEVVDQ